MKLMMSMRQLWHHSSFAQLVKLPWGFWSSVYLQKLEGISSQNFKTNISHDKLGFVWGFPFHLITHIIDVSFLTSQKALRRSTFLGYLLFTKRSRSGLFRAFCSFPTHYLFEVTFIDRSRHNVFMNVCTYQNNKETKRKHEKQVKTFINPWWSV